MRTAFPVFNGYAPKEGPKALPVDFDFTTLGTFAFDLMLENSEGVIQFVQSVYVDNSDNPGALTMRFAQTGQRLVIPANSQGQYPVICPDQTQVTMSSPVNASAVGRIILMNVPMPYTQWGPVTVNVPAVNITPVVASNFSGTIAAGGVSQVAIPANAARLGFTIQNASNGAEILLIDFGTAAAPGSAIELLPGQIFPPNGSPYISRQSINVRAATTGHAFIAKEYV